MSVASNKSHLKHSQFQFRKKAYFLPLPDCMRLEIFVPLITKFSSIKKMSEKLDLSNNRALSDVEKQIKASFFLSCFFS